MGVSYALVSYSQQFRSETIASTAHRITAYRCGIEEYYSDKNFVASCGPTSCLRLFAFILEWHAPRYTAWRKIRPWSENVPSWSSCVQGVPESILPAHKTGYASAMASILDIFIHFDLMLKLQPQQDSNAHFIHRWCPARFRPLHPTNIHASDKNKSAASLSFA
nr:hypothetical protein CFP56_09172 [Quercus suber]